MKYIANQNISDFKKGDEVPAEIAEVWVNMYKFPPVDVQQGNSKPKPIVKEDEDSNESIMDTVKKSFSGNKSSKRR